MRLLILLALSGCTLLPPDHYVSGVDWVKVETVKVADGEVWTICAPALGLTGFAAIMAQPLACSILNLNQGKCYVVIGEHSTPGTIKHEQMHCRGYSHDGSLLKYRDAWRSNQERDL